MPMIAPMSIRQDIIERIFATPLADTHNHLMPDSLRCAEQHDFTMLFDGYAAGVLLRCGMTPEEMRIIPDKTRTPEEKWAVLAPYWPLARTTGIMRSVLYAMRDLFGVEDLNAASALSITEQIRASNVVGRSRQVLQQMGHLHHVQINSTVSRLFPLERLDEEPGWHLFDLDVSGMINGLAIADLELRSGITINAFEQFLLAVDWCFEHYSERAVALKAVNNYFRALDYHPADRQQAVRTFDTLNRERRTEEFTTTSFERPFEDYMYGYLLEKAVEYRLPFRNHIGFTAGISPQSANHPALMEPVIKSHPQVRFILLHAGYPFLQETIGLCMAYPHIYADLGWIWQLDPVWSMQFVREFITSVGARQLLLFGGDSGFAEVGYGYACTARRGFALTLMELVQDGLIDEIDVNTLIPHLCYENARDCFNLERFGL